MRKLITQKVPDRKPETSRRPGDFVVSVSMGPEYEKSADISPDLKYSQYKKNVTLSCQIHVTNPSGRSLSC